MLYLKSLRSAMLGISALLSAGCATVVHQPEAVRDYTSMYVIGNFTWWEADENYRLKPLGENVFGAQVKLIADGQPYDFKFADRHWTPGYSCGNPEAKDGKPLTVKRAAIAECYDSQSNFQFTPTETGIYQFTIDFTLPSAPRVSVSLI